MSRYTPINNSSPSSRRSSVSSSLSITRRPSLSLRSSFMRSNNTIAPVPVPGEMEAAFELNSDDENDDEEIGAEGRGLLGITANSAVHRTREGDGNVFDYSGGGSAVEYDVNGNPVGSVNQRVPGDYDFEREYPSTYPPPIPTSSPPPFQPYSRHHPAPDNSNGIIPTSPPAIPRRNRYGLGGTLIGSLLPSYFGSQPRGPRRIDETVNGVFANLAARPDAPMRIPRDGEETGPEWVPEDSQKDGPPSYTAALRDAVPPYWEHQIVLPSHTSPFGSMATTMSGDEILIDGMPVGNFFAFAWNVLVSASFQFIGFLLTYVLHTSHASKHGSRAGLGITLIQYGFTLRARAEKMITTGEFPVDDSLGDTANATEGIVWNPGFIFPEHQDIHGHWVPEFTSVLEAENWAAANNESVRDVLDLPSAAQVGQANEWLSFVLMAVGWFLLLTSLGSYWRVKRFEKGLRESQQANDADPTAELGNTPTVAPESHSPLQFDFYAATAGRAVGSIQTFARDLRREIRRRSGIEEGDQGGGVGQGHELLFTREEDADEADGYPGNRRAERVG